MNYKVADFDYYLPSELIAQKPVKPRDNSRLLLLSKLNGQIKHQHFYDIIDYLNPGDLLVLNNSQVFPARLIGERDKTGGAVEIFLHRKLNKQEIKINFLNNTTKQNKINVWECLVRGHVKAGQLINFSAGLEAEILVNNINGTRQVKFNLNDEKFWKVINKIGEVPLPPYIKRSKILASDKNNYQTIFADKHKIGSVAAPTAGLHFTKELLNKIKNKGINIAYVTLHVGLGTFAPVKTENILDHHMHSEFAEINIKTQQAILAVKKNKKRIIAVGTTSCRTLESFDWQKILKKEKPSSQSFWTDIFIYPGYHFKLVDALITNFHLPKSTLLMLVSALAGKKLITSSYQEAIELKYRFFSYGDAMFIY